MRTRQEVANQLREAATELQKLSNENKALKQENASLLEKVASLKTNNEIDTDYNTSNTALQKEAEFGFSPRGENGFGSSINDLPMMNSDLSAEERLNMILNGESPSDFE